MDSLPVKMAPLMDLPGAKILEIFYSTISRKPSHHIYRGNETNHIGNKWFDAVLMGRKTYEVGSNEGYTNPYPTLDQHVFSQTMKKIPDENVHLIRENAMKHVQKLKQKTRNAIWLCGGSNLASQLFEEKLIDKMIVKLNPVLFGSGIPIFSGSIKQTALELYDTKVFKSGHVILYYTIND